MSVCVRMACFVYVGADAVLLRVLLPIGILKKVLHTSIHSYVLYLFVKLSLLFCLYLSFLAHQHGMENLSPLRVGDVIRHP